MGDLMRRRFAMLAADGELPPGYRRLEYITSTTGAYIDTGMQLQQGDKVTLKFYSATPTEENAIWGYRWNGSYSSGQQFYLRVLTEYRYITIGKGAFESDVGNNRAFDYDTINTVVMDSANNSVTVNGETPSGLLFDFGNGKTFNSSGMSVRNPYLFAFNNKGSTAIISKSTRIYSYKVERGGAAVQNLVPVINQSNVYGMYDTATGTFFGSSASGKTFTGA